MLTVQFITKHYKIIPLIFKSTSSLSILNGLMWATPSGVVSFNKSTSKYMESEEGQILFLILLLFSSHPWLNDRNSALQKSTDGQAVERLQTFRGHC